MNTKLAETFEDQGSAHLSRWARIETDFPLTFLHSVWNVPRERGDEPIPPFWHARRLPTLFPRSHLLIVLILSSSFLAYKAMRREMNSRLNVSGMTGKVAADKSP